MGDYQLKCLEGGETVNENYTLKCPNGHNGLLRAEYASERLLLKDLPGIFKFYDWLPVHSVLDTNAAPVAFRSEIAKELGLTDLLIGFTGYYPERDAFVESCTFKELEALPTFARLRDHSNGKIVLASAGNTARAFAQTAEKIGSEITIVVPEKAKDRLIVRNDSGKVRLIAVKGDYADAIAVADRIVGFGGSVPEGGARNVARRDGMGTVMLQCTLTAEKLPDHYFQGVGSGTGGISAWEASIRLIKDGRFGNKLPKLHLAQNEPFTPMSNAWNAGRRNIRADDMPIDKTMIDSVFADVLTNRSPPYSITGGVFDAMTSCGGTMPKITNNMAMSAEKLWMSFEDVRPDPAASVALAALIDAVENNAVNKNDRIFLNMTGGGLERVKEDIDMTSIGTYATIDTDIDDNELRRVANE